MEGNARWWAPRGYDEFANGAGLTRWSVPIPNASVLVHSVELEWQCVTYGSSILMTNGIRATIGGGL